MQIKTKRLLLRNIEKKDAKSIVENINNLDVSKWLLVIPYPYKLKDANWWINKAKKQEKEKPRKDYTLGIALKQENKIIGAIGIHHIEYNQGKAAIGYWLGTKHHNQGYGSEALKAVINFAFNKLKLRRLEAGVYTGNNPSSALLERFGFKKEGLKRESAICMADGKIKDERIYGLLKRGYRKRR